MQVAGHVVDACVAESRDCLRVVHFDGVEQHGLAGCGVSCVDVGSVANQRLDVPLPRAMVVQGVTEHTEQGCILVHDLLP